ELRTKLILQGARAHLLGRALFELAELEGAEGDADQAIHLEPEMLENALHFPILALAQPEREPHVGALLAIDLGLDRTVMHAVDLDAVLQAADLTWGDPAKGAPPIAPQPAGLRMGEEACEASVIGEEK